MESCREGCPASSVWLFLAGEVFLVTEMLLATMRRVRRHVPIVMEVGTPCSCIRVVMFKAETFSDRTCISPLFNPPKEFDMKKYLIIFTALAVGVAIAFAFSQQNKPNALTVSEVGADPAAYSGTITVSGIMAGVYRQDPTIFGVMDVKELQCKTANCNRVIMPVKYQGQQPVLGDEIRVTGNLVHSGQGYLFVAQNLKVVRNHKIGG